MTIAVAIPNHSQQKQVAKTIKQLMKQTVVPDVIYIMSDDKPLYTECDFVTQIVNKHKIGRCANRNSVIRPFIESGIDYLVFMDGDCCPKDNTYIERYVGLLSKYDLVFGTREHTTVSKRMKMPASDLLTANMDNMWQGKPIDYTDLRVVSGAVNAWQTATTDEERIDLMLTGMVGWSCNFGFSKSGLEKLTGFMKDRYGLVNEIFDSSAFKDGWGYEDVAMGLDAMYAGLSVWIDDDIVVVHKSHDRTDGLFDHVKGRHMIMERYRELQRSKSIKNLIYISAIVASAFFTGGLITGLVTIAINFEKMMMGL